jgi:hypothetical protein
MSTVTIVIIVVVVIVVLAVAAFVLRPQLRRRHLQQKFGPEYDHTVAEKQDRREAERELTEREKRHAQLTLRPLSAAAREKYTRDWSLVQEQFVDSPADAVAAADQLLTNLMAERGYPTNGYEQQIDDLSVEHAQVIEHYRTAHEVALRQERGEATTEDLRNALVHYREPFENLLGADRTPDETDPAAGTAPEPAQVPAEDDAISARHPADEPAGAESADHPAADVSTDDEIEPTQVEETPRTSTPETASTDPQLKR